MQALNFHFAGSWYLLATFNEPLKGPNMVIGTVISTVITLNPKP